MAMPSNKSSSPLTAPSSRSNPNLRSSEISNAVRRSFSGNPFHKPSIISNPRSFNPNTPANSPSDFPRRNSVGGRESVGSFGDYDDKENGKDHIPKLTKVRSPSASTKSMRNFMSPTISASSKITESPRKKVLTERNEPARTSFSSTEGKSPIGKVTFVNSVEEKKFQPFSDGVIKEETEKHTTSMVSEGLKAEGKSPIRKVTFAEAVEEKKFQPFSDGFIKEETAKHTASMVSEDLKAEGKSPIRKVTIADSVEEKKFQPFSDGVITEETQKHTASMVSEDLKAEGLHSKNETESASEAVTDEPDCVNLDPSFKLSPTPPPVSSTSSIIAPLDADPSIPPYDPKLNYLSPRPQFLHYKPNPRVKLYKERECMKLDDSFSDTELTEEALSDWSEKESEVSSDEIVSEEKSHVSEASPINGTPVPEEEIAEAKGVAKPGFSTRSKAIALLLLLSVACVSISFTNSQVFDPLFKDLTILPKAYDLSEFSHFARANFDRFSELAKENLDGLARNFHIWYTKWMSSSSELISTFRGVQNLGHLHYWNLTCLQENIEVAQFPIFDHGENLMGEASQVETPVLNVEENDDFTESCEDTGDIPAEHYDPAYEEQEVEELEPVPPLLKNVDDNDAAKKIDTYEVLITEAESASSASESGKVSEPTHSESNIDYPDIVSETCEIHIEEQAPEKDAPVIMNLEDQPDLNSEVAEIHTDHLPDLNSEVAEIHTDGQLDLNSEIDTKVYHDVQLKSEEKSESVEAVIVASMLLFLSIIAGTAFKWLWKKGEGRRTMATSTSSMEQPHLVKTKHVNHKVEASPEEPSLRNGPIEMDVLGESCPSEMSTFQKSSSYYSQSVLKEQNEAQSPEEKPKKSYRRESLASSDSMGGSASYGSFTTYEKLSSKHGHGNAGIVTPVRRSSRIKSLATSPL